jgi:hypothetical protein
MVYISLRKLLSLAIHYGLKTSSFEAEAEIGGGASVRIALPPVDASVEGTLQARRVDPARDERNTVRLLERVVARLSKSGLPDLESAEDHPREGEWFAFRRPLRFGVGCADSEQSVKALIAVDEHPVPPRSGRPGLMMNGSLRHIRPPYAVPELLASAGSRSGSGTGQFFVWWDEFRRSWEARQEVDLLPGASLPGTERSPRGSWAALSMYGLFTSDAWLRAPGIPKLLHGARCEGIAQASYIAVGSNLALVTASPLYIRVRSNS